MRMFLSLAILLLAGVLQCTSGSTPAMCGIETCEELRRSVNNNFHAIAKVEVRDRSELARLIKREIMVELKEMIKKEIKEELKDWAAKEKEQTLADVKVAVEERLLREENERTLMDDQILTQVRQLQRSVGDTLDKVTGVKNEVTIVSERGRIETDLLEVRVKETEDLARSCLASQGHTEEAVRRNLSLSSAEVLKTLTDHTSDISSIDTRLSRVENRCSGPPHVENGHPMVIGLGGRDHEDVVTYACRGDKVPAGNDKMRCLYGKWTGEIPRCVDPVCTLPCENGGKCIKNDTCSCPPSFTGDRCQNASDHAQCGLDLRNVGVNGSGAVSGNSSSGAPSRPWMAAVYRKGYTGVACSGSIIHPRFILTRAGCVHLIHTSGVPKLMDATDLTVRLGFTDTVDLTHLQDHNVRTIHVHPLYNRSNYWEDAIALLELEKPIDYDLFVGPVCLPPRETPEVNRFYEPQSSVHVIGWNWDGSSLLEYPAVIQPQDICERRFLERYGRNLTDRWFCAASSGAAECRSTSGRLAAVQSRPDGRGGLVWTQVGVGGDCWNDGSSSSGSRTYFFFFRLQHLVPWIEEAVGGAAP